MLEIEDSIYKEIKSILKQVRKTVYNGYSFNKKSFKKDDKRIWKRLYSC